MFADYSGNDQKYLAHTHIAYFKQKHARTHFFVYSLTNTFTLNYTVQSAGLK